MFVPEDKSTDCDGDDHIDDSICRGYRMSVNTDPQNIKFDIISTRINENQRKQHVVSKLNRVINFEFL